MFDPSRALRFLSVLAVLALVACGGAGSFDGTVNGFSLSVSSSFFFPVREGSSSSEVKELVLYMSERTGICEAFKAGNKVKDARLFAAVLSDSDVNLNRQVIAPGAYSVGQGLAGKGVTAGLTQSDGSCANSVAASATAGTLNLSSYGAEPGGKMNGTFDLSFAPDGEKGKGFFNAVLCDFTPGAPLMGCE
ncbi:MAG TPA: hypothetical protein VIG99_09920 [Myxococcaceae bacterium]|jgi:hypothetical protein